MMYRKIIHGGYILGLAMGVIGDEISEEEYNTLTEIFHSMPSAQEGYSYCLTENLEWVEVKLADDISDAEAFDIIFGGEA